MRVFWACLLVSVAVWAHSQTVPKSDDAAQSHLSIADFGLAYPLSNDWVRATELLRRRAESSNPRPNFEILLAALCTHDQGVVPGPIDTLWRGLTADSDPTVRGPLLSGTKSSRAGQPAHCSLGGMLNYYHRAA